jgi:arylsulfatase A-like enzyme
MNYSSNPIPKLFCAFLILMTLGTGCKKTEVNPPNVIFILVDDMGWTDLGSYGSSFYETPNIDQLASEGALFTNAYAASPVCSPTRAAIFTGKYPTRVGITDWIPGQDPKNRKLLGPEDLHQLPLEEVTLAEQMKENGYKTFFAGKWHLGSDGYFPEQQGFDLNYGGHHMGQPPGGYYSPYNNPKLNDGPEGEYLTDRLTDESLNFIENIKEDPFFLFLSYYTVHTPIQANREYIGRFREKLSKTADSIPVKIAEHEGFTVQNQVNPDYASMIYALDVNIGRIMSKLDELNLSENTIVIFTSDNGGLSTLGGFRSAPTSVKPLRAGKGWCYEGGIRVPLIIKYPGSDAMKIDHPVISMDHYPTILELAGLPLHSNQHIDGKSLVPVLNGNNIDRESIFWHFPHYHGSTWTPGTAIRSGKWKLIQFYDYETVELFDLEKDLGELNDLSSVYPEKVKELQERLREIQLKTNAQLPSVNPDF